MVLMIALVKGFVEMVLLLMAAPALPPQRWLLVLRRGSSRTAKVRVGSRA
jgi:hypothetical protein